MTSSTPVPFASRSPVSQRRSFLYAASRFLPYAFFVIICLLITCGCHPRQETPTISRSSYILGHCYLNNTNSAIDQVFVLPDAPFVFLVLVLEGVDFGSVEANHALEALQDVELAFTLSNVSRNETAYPRVLELHDLGNFANWHKPNAAFVMNPPLINYGKSLKLPGYSASRGSSAVERMAVHPGDEYRLVFQVNQPGTLTNKVAVRADFMGIRIRLDETNIP